MTGFSFYVRNLFRDTSKSEEPVTYVEHTGPLSFWENKSISIDIKKNEPVNFFGIWFDLSFQGRSHAGFSIMIDVWKYYFNLEVYDRRHWNYKENRWCTPEEMAAENYHDYSSSEEG